MRTLNVEEISKNIKEMCIEANHFLSKDMDIAMKNAVSTEKSPLGKKILSQLQDNLKIKVAPKGFGSENMSRVFMLKPADGIEGVKEAVLTAEKMPARMPVLRWLSAWESAAHLKNAH